MTTTALMEPHPYAASMQRQMIGEIEAANPRFVVFVKGGDLVADRIGIGSDGLPVVR